MISLGISDLLMGIAVEILSLALTGTAAKPCLSLITSFCIISGVSSLLNMAPLSIHRYFAVEVPLSFQEVMTRLRILISITILWIYAVHFSLLPLVDWVDSRYQIYLYDLGCFLHSVPGYFHGVWRDFQIDSRAYQDARTM